MSEWKLGSRGASDELELCSDGCSEGPEEIASPCYPHLFLVQGMLNTTSVMTLWMGQSNSFGSTVGAGVGIPPISVGGDVGSTVGAGDGLKVGGSVISVGGDVGSGLVGEGVGWIEGGYSGAGLQRQVQEENVDAKNVVLSSGQSLKGTSSV